MLAGADLLIILTQVDGLLDEKVTSSPWCETLIGRKGSPNGNKGRFSVGGMVSKLEAVKMAVDAGITTVIINGRARTDCRRGRRRKSWHPFSRERRLARVVRQNSPLAETRRQSHAGRNSGFRAARAASPRVRSRNSSAQKNAALLAMADEMMAQRRCHSGGKRERPYPRRAAASPARCSNVALNRQRLEAMADGIRQVAELPDPVGEMIREWTQPNGIRISKVRVPIGVIGIIYESRPNVTSDAAILCTKTGNATILRGGSEAIHSNLAIAEALQQGGAEPVCPTTASSSSRYRSRGGAVAGGNGSLYRPHHSPRRQSPDRSRGRAPRACR